MPYDWEGNYIESKADKRTDRLGFGEIGGVGQLIYNSFRFADYALKYDNNNNLMICPVCNEKNPPDLTPNEDLTGRDILTGLCDLAKRIDDFSEAPHQELVVEWCKENMHPYAVDYLYSAFNELEFDLKGIDAELLAKDGIFNVDDFMRDLGKLYNAARFYIALEGVVFANEENAYNLYTEGRHFEGLPFFEKYKHSHGTVDIDVSSANGNLLEEMLLYKKHNEENSRKELPESEFAEEPYDDYEYLRHLLLECIPDFRLRLKVNPKTNRMEFSADINSVFDIAWYTLARMLSEQPEPEQKGKEAERPEGIMICCKNCGRFIIRTAKHQQYCNSKECQKVRNAQNQREFRRRKAIEKAHKLK